MGLFGKRQPAAPAHLPADCTACGLPLAGAHDGWEHAICERLRAAEDAAAEVHDNGPLEDVEPKLRSKDLCPWQIRARGWDGGGIYCGRDITDTGGDDPDLFCLEHQAKFYGDEEGAAQERNEHMWNLLEQAGALQFNTAGQPEWRN
jgi:hypothetical protein